MRPHGEDPSSWPKLGCGAKFVPWARGASKVLEIRDEFGNWRAILADRLPEQLDDEIKKVLHAWHEAAGRVTPEDIMMFMPLSYPRCSAYRTGVPGVSRFDIEKWQAEGSPTLSFAGWVALCQLISCKDPVNLGHIITLCKSCELAPPAGAIPALFDTTPEQEV